MEDNQEALDMVIQAYRVGEDRRVMLPMMVCLDGFVLSHTVERVEVPDPNDVDKFLPKFVPLNTLDVARAEDDQPDRPAGVRDGNALPTG